jgi:VanZ family protein
MRLIYAVFVVGIVYGSIYPFNFSSPESWNIFSAEFLQTLFARTSRSDLLGNIALFVPLGVIARVVMPVDARATDLVLHGLLALFVAVAVQILQLVLPTRDPSLQDAVWNMLGWFVGVVGARLLTRFNLVEWRPDQQQQHWLIPVFLMMCWLAYDLFPYVPTIDFQGYQDALKPLLLHPLFRIDSFLMRFSAWLLFAALMNYVWGARATCRLFPWVSLASLALKVAIVTNELNVHSVAAVLLANLVWVGIGRRQPLPYFTLALTIFAAIVAKGLLPLEYDFGTAGNFHFIPFAGALTGSMVINFLAILMKCYLFGGFFWLMIQARASLIPAMMLATVAVLFVEIAQVFSVRHTAEITDVILLILIGVMMRMVIPSGRSSA